MASLIKWNATRLEQAADCLFQFYLINIEGEKPITTGPMARGLFIHRKMILFYNDDGSPFYNSGESFANAMGAQWHREVMNTGKIYGKKVYWRDKSEPWEIKEDIKNICRGVYDRYVEEGPPLHREYPFSFLLDGVYYNGRMDEIRVGAVIRELKTGWKKPGDMTINYGPQLTLYNLALGCICKKTPKFAESIGISPEDAKKLGGNPDYISPIIGAEYHFMRNDEIISLERNNSHYYDLCTIIDGIEERIKSGNIYPERKKYCDSCSVRHPCDARGEGFTTPRKTEHQLELFGDLPYFRRKKRKKDARQLRLFKKRE